MCFVFERQKETVFIYFQRNALCADEFNVNEFLSGDGWHGGMEQEYLLALIKVENVSVEARQEKKEEEQQQQQEE